MDSSGLKAAILDFQLQVLWLSIHVYLIGYIDPGNIGIAVGIFVNFVNKEEDIKISKVFYLIKYPRKIT